MDPIYASPWHGLAAMYNALGTFGFAPPKISNKQSLQAIHKSFELDNMFPPAHAHLGSLLAQEFDWKGAKSEFLRALELGPRTWDVWYLYSSYFLLPMRRQEETLAAMRRAQEMDPLSPNIHAYLAYIYITMKQYDRALEQCRNALELDPHSLLANGYIAYALGLKGEMNEAIRILEVVTQLLGRIPVMQGSLGYAYTMAGRKSDAYRILEELHGVVRTAYVPAYSFAMICLGLGVTGKAFDWLDKAVDEHSLSILNIHLSPSWEPLRSHPRYHALLRKLSLEP
jgi:tetratricopeptide (TPR) repeat protein